MRKKKGSLERGLVSSTSTGLWQQGSSFADVRQPPPSIAPPPPPPTLFMPRRVHSQPVLDLKRDGCLSRLPYASLMAFAMCSVGVFIFTLMTWWSFNASVEQIRRLLNITDIPGLDKVYVFFFIAAAAMFVVTAAFLGVGALSTGSTRHEVYARRGARRGGRVLCMWSMVIGALLNAVWMVVTAIAVLLAFVYFVFTQLCATLPTDANEHACLDFSVFRPLVAEFSDASLVLCSGNVQLFCALSSTVVVWYMLSSISALLICAGLLTFVASAAANYSHIGSESKECELREILLAETTGSTLSDARMKSTNSYATEPKGRKMSSSRLIDFQVDSYPTLQEPPHTYGGGNVRKYPSQSALPYCRDDLAARNNWPSAAATEEMMRRNHGAPFYPPRRTVGSAINAARRNSYHNSVNDEYNDLPYH